MLFFMMLILGITTIVVTVFANDIRNFIVDKATDWESSLLELSPAIKDKLEALKKKREAGKDKPNKTENKK